jgi:hypothetical protein
VKLGWSAAGGVALASLVACGGAGPPLVSEPTATVAPAPASAAPLPVAAQPDVELRDPQVALVRGQSVPFDGVEEGLVWPSLAKAVGPRHAGEVVTIQVARGVPVQDLARAAWTVRQADVRIQSADATGVLHAVELRARRDDAPPVSGCHLAVFLRADGSLRIAAPGGPRDVGGDTPAASLARSLADERASCPIKYVAFGAESDRAPWGPVFDVMLAVDRDKSAGDARYVLGQAMHLAPQ